MPWAARSSGRRPPRSAPSNVMRPARTGSRPMIDLSSVVLPTPLRPIRQTTPPSGTWRETSQSTWLSPYATSRPRISSIGFPAPAQIDLHHPVVLLHLFHGPFAEDAPLVEHGDP